MNRIGIMQPYFFPFLGHFGLIVRTDSWVVFDVTQYTRKSWVSRNRILHPKAGWTYIGAPLANPSTSIKIYEALVADPRATERSVLGKLSHYRRRAPFYDAVVGLVEDAFGACVDSSLVHLNVCGLSAVCRYLQIPFRYAILSELGLDLPQDLGPGDWAPAVCERLGASSYVNPIGGRALFDPAEFEARGIELLFAETDVFCYDTGPFEFEPGLSILDVLMWNAPATVAAWLFERTRLETAADITREGPELESMHVSR